MSLKVTKEQFSEWVARAKKGEVSPLHQYLATLYQNGKRSLLQLTQSEDEAEEFFAVAVAKFWEKFVVGNDPLPEVNIGGYIYTMARFHCLDQKRQAASRNISRSMESTATVQQEWAETPKTEAEFRSEEKREELRREALRRGIDKLTGNCRQYFQTVLATGLEKPRDLFKEMGLKDARAVTVLRYDCTKQLKVKAAMELELLLGAEA